MIENSIPRDQANFWSHLCRKILFQALSKVSDGGLRILEEGTETYFGQNRSQSTLTATIQIRNPRAYAQILLGGSIGAGEAYMSEDWDSPDLASVVRLFVRNREVLNQLDRGWSGLSSVVQKSLHRLNKNSITGSQKNIRAHYDLGNEFFELFLDPTWMYSSAYFSDANRSLEEAQTEKIDRICRRLRLDPSHHVLEIGTGWGGFALHAAKNYGCKITTTTISKKQYDLARERVKNAGLSDRVEVLFQDYRKLEGTYDRLVSIEMIEAVGLEFLPTYFHQCSKLLKPDGEMLLQAITIRDQFYEQAKKSVDFIQRYIFPGSGIPSVAAIADAIKNNTDLRFGHLEDFGQDYARTLHLWSQNLALNHAEVLKRGYSEEFYRMWQFYFGYCEGGFLENSIGVIQLQLLKPRGETCKRS